MKTKKPILAWKWLATNRKMAYGDGRKMIAGKTYSVPLIVPKRDKREALKEERPGRRIRIRTCMYGIHASIDLHDAWDNRFDSYTQIARVELSGEVAREADKVAAQRCKVLWIADASKIVRDVTRLRGIYESAKASDLLAKRLQKLDQLKGTAPKDAPKANEPA